MQDYIYSEEKNTQEWSHGQLDVCLSNMESVYHFGIRNSSAQMLIAIPGRFFVGHRPAPAMLYL